MKKLNVFFAALALSLVFAIGAKAQAPADYYAGKWRIVVSGVPGGDKILPIILERKDGKLSGGVLDTLTNKIKTPFTKVEEGKTNTTVYFNMSAHDVYLNLEKKDDNTVNGSMLDMFDCVGTRVAEKKD